MLSELNGQRPRIEFVDLHVVRGPAWHRVSRPCFASGLLSSTSSDENVVRSVWTACISYRSRGRVSRASRGLPPNFMLRLQLCGPTALCRRLSALPCIPTTPLTQLYSRCGRSDPPGQFDAARRAAEHFAHLPVREASARHAQAQQQPRHRRLWPANVGQHRPKGSARPSAAERSHIEAPGRLLALRRL
jgi:hypothetical protein